MTTKSKPRPHLAQVVEIADLSPHLRRIELFAESFSDFPAGQEGSYVKVILPFDGEEKPSLDIKSIPRPTMRSYTIRYFDKSKRILTLDFVVNRHDGPATNWARSAKIGDYVGIAGPGPLKLTDYSADSYLLIGDITSMNALNGYAARFKSQAEVTYIITVPSRADKIEMDIPSNRLHWLVEDENSETITELIEKLAIPLTAETRVFMGLEARAIRPLRTLFQETFSIDRKQIYAVGYWKKGVDADRFGAEKKANPL